MSRVINETHVYTREQLTEMAKNYAKLAIIHGFYVGDFHDQAAAWMPDGSILITTSHTPGSIEDIRKDVRKKA